MRASTSTCCCSAANDFTTRAPDTFSSTVVATPAWRSCTIQEIGNISLRMRRPVKKTNGSGASATRASGTWIIIIRPKATPKLIICSPMSGANVRNIWTERMSLFAREISCPDWTLS